MRPRPKRAGAHHATLALPMPGELGGGGADPGRQPSGGGQSISTPSSAPRNSSGARSHPTSAFSPAGPRPPPPPPPASRVKVGGGAREDAPPRGKPRPGVSPAPPRHRPLGSRMGLLVFAVSTLGRGKLRKVRRRLGAEDGAQASRPQPVSAPSRRQGGWDLPRGLCLAGRAWLPRNTRSDRHWRCGAVSCPSPWDQALHGGEPIGPTAALLYGGVQGSESEAASGLRPLPASPTGQTSPGRRLP